MNFKGFVVILVFAFLLVLGIKAYAATAEAATTINIRSAPSTNSKLLGVFPKGFKAQILATSGEWAKISFQGTVGYVKSSYIKVTKGSIAQSPKVSAESKSKTVNLNLPVAVVLKDGARVRANMSTSSKIVATMNYKDKVYVLSHEKNDWVKVKTLDGKVGYMANYLLKEQQSTSSSRKLSSRGGFDRSPVYSDAAKSLVERILSLAKNYLGIRYRYGGSSPSSGFDCSGFVQFVFRNFGINLERTAADMAASNGVRVSPNELRPGDLLFFDTNGGRNYINHVGIYLGGGRYIHASSAKGCVTISDLTSKYGTSFMMAKRVIR